MIDAAAAIKTARPYEAAASITRTHRHISFPVSVSKARCVQTRAFDNYDRPPTNLSLTLSPSRPSSLSTLLNRINHSLTMRLSSALLLATATAISAQTTYRTSSKRGLVFVPPKSSKDQHDNQIWVENGSDLTWYYNYQVQPSAAYLNRTQEDFEFVPMLWSTDTNFYSSVKALIDGGRNISHILAYNEPDGESSTGGSSIDPAAAATNWISQVEPLRKLGVKVGAPAVTGSPRGFVWLEDFFNSCASQGTNCTIDFIPIHWYGDFGGLASHMGQVNAT